MCVVTRHMRRMEDANGGRQGTERTIQGPVSCTTGPVPVRSTPQIACHLNTKFCDEGRCQDLGRGSHRDQGARGGPPQGPPSLSSSSLQLVVDMNMIQAKRRPEIRGGLRIAIDRRCRWFFGWTGENKWQSRYFATEKLNT
jgi:hypothetical protein